MHRADRGRGTGRAAAPPGEPRRSRPCAPGPTSSTRRRFFDGRLAGLRRLPAAKVERARHDIRLRWLPLRGRRYEARAPREGQRRPPDLLVHRAVGAHPGPHAGRLARRPGWQRGGNGHAPRGRLSWPTTAPRRRDSRSGCSALRGSPTSAYPPAITPTRSSTAACAAGRSYCEARRRADDHLSLVAGITARQRKARAPRDLHRPCRVAGGADPVRSAARRCERSRPRTCP